MYLYTSVNIDYNNVQFGDGATRCENNFACGELDIFVCNEQKGSKSQKWINMYHVK